MSITHRFIAIEGPIGVGKTSLAHKLAETLNAQLLLENAEDNPFLERFYKNPKQMALATQLFFLLQRSQQINDLRQDDLFHAATVADYMIEKDRLFAEVTLAADELALYENVFTHMTINAPKPDLVIYLQASVATLQQRIEKRGIDYERYAQSNYLQRLSDRYTEFFFNYNEAPLLIVNVENINYIDNENDYEDLLAQIALTTSGRHYFNPTINHSSLI